MTQHKLASTISRFAFLLLVLFVLSPVTMADGNAPPTQENCKVKFIKEGGMGSIFLSFRADTKEQCERMKDKDVEVTYQERELNESQ